MQISTPSTYTEDRALEMCHRLNADSDGWSFRPVPVDCRNRTRYYVSIWDEGGRWVSYWSEG